MNRTNQQLIELYRRRVWSLQTEVEKFRFAAIPIEVLIRILDSSRWLSHLYRNDPRPDTDAIPQDYDLEIYFRFALYNLHTHSHDYLMINIISHTVRHISSSAEAIGLNNITDLRNELGALRDQLNTNFNTINHNIAFLHSGERNLHRRSLPVRNMVANYENRLENESVTPGVREGSIRRINEIENSLNQRITSLEDQINNELTDFRQLTTGLRNMINSLEQRAAQLESNTTSRLLTGGTALENIELPIHSSTPIDLSVQRARHQLIEVAGNCISGNALYFIGINVSRFEDKSLVYMERTGTGEVSITFFLRQDYHRPARSSVFPVRSRLLQALFDYLHNGEWPSSVTTVSYTQFRRVFTNPVNLISTLN